MDNFCIKPKITVYESFGEFLHNTEIKSSDLIFTFKFAETSFIQGSLNALKETPRILLIDNYGQGEPDDRMIDSILQEARSSEYSRVIGIGGGSVLDISKLLALEPNGSTRDFFERKVPLKKTKEMLLVPTTCGTGSEVTNISITEIKELNTKLGLAVDELYSDQTALVPSLLSNLPYHILVNTSIDALVHATESYVSPKANQFTRTFSSKAINLIIKSYKKILGGVDYASDKELIKNLLLGSCFAGIAFGNAGVGAVHALSYPFGAKFHVPHGESNYQFFIEVFKTYQSKDSEGILKLLSQELANILGCLPCESFSELEKVLAKLLQKKQLAEYGMTIEDTKSFSTLVIEKQKRLLVNNYVPLDKKDIQGIYERLL